MKQKLLSGRPVVTRASRHDPRGAKLESVAAEFALLAQRRARIARQVDLLARQLDAATAGLDGVQSRMALLAQRLHQIDPDLAQGFHVPSVPLQAAPARLGPTASADSWFAQLVDKAQEPKPEPAADPPRQIAPTNPETPATAPDMAAAPEAAAPQEPSPSSDPSVSVQDTTPQGHAALASSKPAASRAPALSSIGFGPGMVLRFAQLGIETASDLAAADEAALRDSLGDISRLVNVDVWIASAKRACAHAAMRRPETAPASAAD